MEFVKLKYVFIDYEFNKMAELPETVTINNKTYVKWKRKVSYVAIQNTQPLIKKYEQLGWNFEKLEDVKDIYCGNHRNLYFSIVLGENEKPTYPQN